jgi:acyl carrier protein
VTRAIVTDWGYRVHVTPIDAQTAHYCNPHGWCRLCENERKEPYMSDDTKAKIRSVLEEHLGPSQAEIGDQDDLAGTGKTIEWVNVAIALETEFDIRISELAMEKCGTIDMIARLIDTIVASKTASPH